jgi:hypothetical protein
MKDFFQFRKYLDEAKFAGSSIKMFGQSNRKKPIKKEASCQKPIKKEDTSFKVSIDGLPDMYMNDKTPGALLQKLRKIVKQPSMIKDVDRTTTNKVKKAYRDKAQGREVKEYNTVLGDYGTTKSVKKMKNITPGEKFIEAQGADSKGHFRSTKSGAGMTAKGVAAVNRKTGGNLKTAVTGKVKAGSKDAGRRKSFCARMSGMEGPMKDEKGRPTRKAMSLKRWKC